MAAGDCEDRRRTGGCWGELSSESPERHSGAQSSRPPVQLRPRCPLRHSEGLSPRHGPPIPCPRALPPLLPFLGPSPRLKAAPA